MGLTALVGLGGAPERVKGFSNASVPVIFGKERAGSE